jgi:Tfp pilus assembly protein PilV
MTSKFTNTNTKAAGFSIIEVIAVTLIISIGLVGMLSLTWQSIKVLGINRGNLIASQLAQEGIELVRNTRDTDWLTGVGGGWDCSSPCYYLVDYKHPELTPTGAGVDGNQAKLKLDTDGYYCHASLGDAGCNGADTNFNRVISITGSSTASSTVKSWVRYKNGNNFFDYIAETILYDWR